MAVGLEERFSTRYRPESVIRFEIDDSRWVCLEGMVAEIALVVQLVLPVQVVVVVKLGVVVIEVVAVLKVVLAN